MKIRATKSVWALVLLGSALAAWACRSGDGIPSDLAPAQVVRSGGSMMAPAELVWGGWHAVPWDPNAAEALERAYRFELDGQREDAIAELNLGLSVLPGSASLLEARGALHAALGYRRAASRDFDEACKLDSRRPGTWFALGQMRQELGLENQALNALGQASVLGLDTLELYRTEARAYRGLHRRGRAAACYAQAVAAEEPPPHELLVEAASLYFEEDEVSSTAVDKALGLLALELPSDPDGEARMWQVHALLRDRQARDAETTAAGLMALGIESEPLLQWTRLSLLAVQFDDRETRAELEGGVAQAPRKSH